MILKLKIFIYNLIFIKFRIWYLLHFNPLIKSQIKNTAKIPIIIINFNQLFYLKKLVDFLVDRRFENLIIVDNKSTYPPLLEYYKNLPSNVTVEVMDENYGHMVFFENADLQRKYGQGFYVVTDADIVPNENLPEDFMKIMLDVLLKEFDSMNKVGFALSIEKIPDHYAFKGKVMKWEKQFWSTPVKQSLEAYNAWIDTTFAIYKPTYPQNFNDHHFLQGIRVAANFTAVHGGWNLDTKNLSHEQQFYFEYASNSNSWTIDEEGLLPAYLKEI